MDFLKLKKIKIFQLHKEETAETNSTLHLPAPLDYSNLIKIL